MWRHSNCIETDSEFSCFACKKFDKHVQNCGSRLILRDDVVTCAPIFSLDSAFDNCLDLVSSTGECSELGEKQEQKMKRISIVKNLCQVNKKAVELTGIECPSVIEDFQNDITTNVTIDKTNEVTTDIATDETTNVTADETTQKATILATDEPVIEDFLNDITTNVTIDKTNEVTTDIATDETTHVTTDETTKKATNLATDEPFTVTTNETTDVTTDLATDATILLKQQLS